MDDAKPHRLRLRFAKRGDLRLVSHHDLMRCLERTIRRADLPMAQSQGFNPRPKVSFPSALALGIEGRREVLELELAEPLGPEEVLRRLAEATPPGLDFFEAAPTVANRAAQVVAVDYLVNLPPDRRSAAAIAVAETAGPNRLPLHPSQARPRRPDRPPTVRPRRLGRTRRRPAPAAEGRSRRLGPARGGDRGARPARPAGRRRRDRPDRRGAGGRLRGDPGTQQQNRQNAEDRGQRTEDRGQRDDQVRTRWDNPVPIVAIRDPGAFG